MTMLLRLFSAGPNPSRIGMPGRRSEDLAQVSREVRHRGGLPEYCRTAAGRTAWMMLHEFRCAMTQSTPPRGAAVEGLSATSSTAFGVHSGRYQESNKRVFFGCDIL